VADAGAPQDLSLREEGVLVFRRDTGPIELVETVNTSRYGRLHDRHERPPLALPSNPPPRRHLPLCV